ncbi:hypothetical protein [Streptomyces sp. NPDC059862]|uniref:hypothetical protein n=1 Tax=unclassified Streptomyces TaxID=2593676 RepID=UPI0036323C33
MSFGGPNPYQPQWPPNGGPYPPPPNQGPYVPPPNPGPYPPPYVPPQPGQPPYNPYAPHPPGFPPHPQPYVPPRRNDSLWSLLVGLRGAEWPPLRDLLRAGRTRIHGCVWALLVFPCSWFAIVPLMVGYSFARSARIRAHRLFPVRGHRHFDDPHVWRIQKARAWTAAVMSLLLLAVYGKPEDISEAQQQYMMRLAVTPPLLLVSAPVVIALLFRMASAAARAEMRPRLRAAGRSALWYVGAVTAVPLCVAGITVTGSESEVPGGAWYGSPWVVLAIFLPFVWLLFFLGFATGPAIRSGFNAAAVHPALPALLTGTLVWEFAAISMLAGGLPPGPPLIQFLALLGGPASVTAVAWWEIRRLRTLHGVTLRR